MRLETERLLLRDWTLEDAEAAHSDIFGDPEVTKYLGDGRVSPDLESTTKSLQRAMERSKDQPFGSWALVEKSSGDLVGGAILVKVPGGDDYEVGYHLRQKSWGMGYATEITKALVKYGFREAGLSRIVGVTYPVNKPSQRVLEKAGLAHCGLTKYMDLDMELYVIEREPA